MMAHRRNHGDPENEHGFQNTEEDQTVDSANGGAEPTTESTAQHAAGVTQPDPVAEVLTNGTGQPQSATTLAAEYLDALQRERANFINYRRRTEQERAETVQYATANLLKRLLPVVDDFDRALAAIPAEERENNRWVEGVELIARKLRTILEQEGVEPIEALGQPFDPNLHEAVAFDDNSEGGGHTDTVAEVYSKGYKLHDRVLRPAMVKVSRG
jgi:molecular chaperone GrpE